MILRTPTSSSPCPQSPYLLGSYLMQVSSSRIIWLDYLYTQLDKIKLSTALEMVNYCSKGGYIFLLVKKPRTNACIFLSLGKVSLIIICLVLRSIVPLLFPYYSTLQSSCKLSFLVTSNLNVVTFLLLLSFYFPFASRKLLFSYYSCFFLLYEGISSDLPIFTIFLPFRQFTVPTLSMLFIIDGDDIPFSQYFKLLFS